MLSIFPELLNYSIWGIFIIRLVISFTLFYLAGELIFKKQKEITQKISSETGNSSFKHVWIKGNLWFLSLTSFLVAGFLVIGFLTQISAIIAAYLLFNLMYVDREQKFFYIVLAIISLTLLFFGPGPWSIDLPL